MLGTTRTRTIDSYPSYVLVFTDGFTLAAEYQGIIAKSSLPIFSYTRSVFSLILSWQY